jgi:4-amino-4-deoxy-L-arabinose transferase-like glycosyltransferase
MRNAATTLSSSKRSTDATLGQSAIVTGFTAALGLWALIGIGSLAIRLWNLGNAPLTNIEATAALSSLAITHGESVSTNNPLFTILQAIIFSIFGASDFSARLPIAIAGALLCLTPALLRPQIGRQRALVFSGLLALSPTLVFASRQSEGALLAWILAFAIWCFWQRASYRAALITAGVLLACGLDAVSPVIVIAISIVIDTFRANKKRKSLPITRTDLILGVATFLFATTGFLWHLSGLGDAFNGFAMWPATLAATSQISFARLVIGSVVYEPLILLCGVCGVTILLLRHRFTMRETIWLVWLIMGLILLGLNNSRDAVGLTPVVIAAAAYAGITFGPLFESPPSDGYISHLRRATVIVFTLSVVMLVYAYMGLSMYGAQRTTSWLFTSLVGLVMVAGIGVIASLTYSADVAMRGAGLAMGLCLLLYTISTGYALTQTRATDPGEAYISEAADTGLRDLVRTIQTASTRAYGDPNSIPIQALDTAPPALRWALKDQREVTYVANAENGPTLLTSINRRPDGSTYAYSGSAFRIVTSASLSNIRCEASETTDQLDCTPLARWLTQRTFDERVVTRWIFWMRSDIAEKANGH